LEDHGTDVSLVYLTDSESILQVIHRWIGCEEKLNLSKSPDADVLKKIIIKLQKRVLAGTVTLVVKVKDHRGDPLNEEADIRAITQYVSIKSALERTLHHQGWTVSQKSFIAGARSLNEKDLHDNLSYFKVPETGIESIGSKLALKIFVNMKIF
jgi:hypothetical protein